MAVRFDEIGKRLKAYRMGRGLLAEEVAERLGISRAAVYRIESGGVVKIETLDRLATLLDTSLASLLGAGVEYYSNPVSYFERMRQIEEQAEQIVAHFSPISYLLTSADFSDYLRQTLPDSLEEDLEDRQDAAQQIRTIIDILDERKTARDRRGLSVVNLVSLLEIERWLKLGIVGQPRLSADAVDTRREAVRAEIEHLIRLIEDAPMGVQIGLIAHSLPNTTFQLFRTPGATFLGLSPYRLGGELPNIRSGIATLTADAQPVRLYEALAQDAWRRALKGPDAARALRDLLARTASAGGPRPKVQAR